MERKKFCCIQTNKKHLTKIFNKLIKKFNKLTNFFKHNFKHDKLKK